MEKRNEVILKNTILENVMRYLYGKLKEIGGKAIEQRCDDGKIITYTIGYPSRNSNTIEVGYKDDLVYNLKGLETLAEMLATSETPNTTTPSNVIKIGEKIYDFNNLDLTNRDSNLLMRFTGMQLQTNTVKIKAECNHPAFLSVFEHYWAEMLKDFATDAPHSGNKLTVRQIDNVVQANLFVVKGWEHERQEQGTTILYTVWTNAASPKLYLGVFRVWEWVDGSGRCGWQPLPEITPGQKKLRDFFHLEMIMPILAKAAKATDNQSAAQIDAGQVIEPLKPEKFQAPEKGSSIAVWFDYYHAMKKANYKISFTDLAKLSGYSANTFKQEHGRYKLERGIT